MLTIIVCSQRLHQSLLIRLNEINPNGVPKILADVVTIEEQNPGTVSLQTLFTLKHLFIRESTPTDLQVRFLAVVIKATQNIGALSKNEYELAYYLLRSILPTVEKLQPSLYPIAAAQLAALGNSLPNQSLSNEQAEDRIKQSNNQLYGSHTKIRIPFRFELPFYLAKA